jgi:hypothetical protein
MSKLALKFFPRAFYIGMILEMRGSTVPSKTPIIKLYEVKW